MHGNRHPLTRHLQKRFVQLGIASRHSCQTYAFTRVVHTLLVGDLYSTVSHNPGEPNATVLHIGQEMSV
jgi:hypothetical protein